METVTEKILDVVVYIDIDIPDDCDMKTADMEDFEAEYWVRYEENGELYSDYNFHKDAGDLYTDISDIIASDMESYKISEYEIFDVEDEGDRITAKIKIKNPA